MGAKLTSMITAQYINFRIESFISPPYYFGN